MREDEARMVETTISLDDDVALRLEQLARASGRSSDELLREAVAIYLRSTPPPLRSIPGAGAFRSGRSDVSERAEELLGEIMARRS